MIQNEVGMTIPTVVLCDYLFIALDDKAEINES